MIKHIPINSNKKTNEINFIWFVPIYCFALIAAYLLASKVFPLTIPQYSILGFSFSTDLRFHNSLFLHLTIGIVYLFLLHVWSRISQIKLSFGNMILAYLFILTLSSFIIGINIPLLHSTKLWIIEEDLSLVQVLQHLKEKGELQLYYIMLVFTFIVPLLKILKISYDIFLSRANGRHSKILSLMSKWAMLDILIIGIIVSTMKSGNGLAEINTGRGLTFFVLSVLLSMVITTRLPYTKNN